ncbi:TIGR02594 family protein [Xanthobacter wiegelii]|uniref:TIGR02594 family protein n=1 Tax=Xanthobacter wiegelii TaxID=3119913 RepID=UPI00372CB9C6
MNYPWMNVAKSLIGTKEIKGPKDSPIIMGWAKEMKQWFPDDETAWCGLFVGYCMFKALPQEPRPKNILGARQWEKFGVKLVKPVYGSVVTFWRGSPQSGFGHVGFYVGEDDESYHILGGNQGDSVSEARMPKHRFTAARWPGLFDYPNMKGTILKNLEGGLSTNEA